jgi:hypothetical protein
MRSLRRCAKKLLGLNSVQGAFTGAVVAIQRTDSALRLNVHLQVLALDGVYVHNLAGILMSHPLPTPGAEEVAHIARRTAERLSRAFEARGRSSPWQAAEPSEPDPEPLSAEQPGLFACYEAAARGISVSGERAGQPALRLVVGQGLAPGNLARERPEPADPAPSCSSPTTCSSGFVPPCPHPAGNIFRVSSRARCYARASMAGDEFALFDTSIGRCGVVWGAGGIKLLQLPKGRELATRARLLTRHPEAREAVPPIEVRRRSTASRRSCAAPRLTWAASSSTWRRFRRSIAASTTPRARSRRQRGAHPALAAQPRPATQAPPDRAGGHAERFRARARVQGTQGGARQGRW